MSDKQPSLSERLRAWTPSVVHEPFGLLHNAADEIDRQAAYAEQQSRELTKLHNELKALKAQEPVAWIRWEWSRTGSKSLVFEKPSELSLSEEARGVVYEPLVASPVIPAPAQAAHSETAWLIEWWGNPTHYWDGSLTLASPRHLGDHQVELGITKDPSSAARFSSKALADAALDSMIKARKRFDVVRMFNRDHYRVTEHMWPAPAQKEPGLTVGSIWAAWHDAGVDISGGNWARFAGMLPLVEAQKEASK